MVAIFIITRAFAISALFAGVFQIASAAPVGSPQGVLAYNYGKRWCRQMGCLFEVPTSSASPGTPTATGVQAAYDSLPSAADTMSVGGSPDRLLSDEAETVFTTEKSGAETSEQPEDSEVSAGLESDTQSDASDVHTVDNSPAVEDLD
ncbi:hypothetical protein PYCCODRAFT_1481365 [Trametes coccinea BRFM310]|uniref:Uncharacterized protein n=1 Tax=Trametes coccinea (strain BRFM310) TaxID=1353009 RepID=A0A1Y2I845_TRAC3|nr:hypothetical protein PYCCODRAFT_1481365 [Trametes coccinea BRFM310]